jgi:hypothetical protein
VQILKATLTDAHNVLRTSVSTLSGRRARKITAELISYQLLDNLLVADDFAQESANERVKSLELGGGVLRLRDRFSGITLRLRDR